jgi:cell filamentation protein
MQRSVANDIEIKVLLKTAWSDRIDARALFLKGIDMSCFYGGYSAFNATDL